jgi:tetratricopeptide (TPR) repeat protein
MERGRSRGTWVRWLEPVGKGLLALGMAGAALALGALHTGVLMAVAVVLTLACALLWASAEPMRARPVASVVIAAGLLATLFTALQLVPLPAGVLAAIAPENADAWARVLTPLREPGPTSAPISLDPTATRVQVLRGVVYLLAFASALRVARKREGVVWLQGCLVVIAVIVALAALAHPALGAERVFGIYKPVSTFGRHTGPLLNANHFAAYVNIGMLAGLGLALAPMPSYPRVLPIAAVLLLVAVELWVASRGGVVAAMVGIVLTVWIARRARTPREERTGLMRLLPGLLFAVVGVGLSVIAAEEEAWTELSSKDLSKLDLARQALATVRHYPVFGMGRGAFESVFPAHREGADYVVFTHPENLVAQWTTEWGVVVAVGLLVALVYVSRPSVALVRSAVPLGAWSAIVATAIHNLLDFNSEVPAVGVAIAVCFACVVGGTGGEKRLHAWIRWASRPRLMVAASGALGAAALLLAAGTLGKDLRSDREALRARVLDAPRDRAGFVTAAREAMLRHPAEPYLPFAGGLRAGRAGDESVIPWVARTLERSPVHGPAHMLLARELGARYPAQARLEYRLAMKQAPALWTTATREGARLVRDFDTAMELVPEGPEWAGMLNLLATELAPRLPASARRLDREIDRRAPRSPDVLTRAVTAHLVDLRNLDSSPWCESDGEACRLEALRLADALRNRLPTRCVGHAAHAELLAMGGEAERATKELEAATFEVEDRMTCAATLVSLQRTAGANVALSRTLERLANAGCDSDDECVRMLLFIAGVEEQRGHARSALVYFRKAHARSPDADGPLSQVARVASQLKLHAEALEAYRELVRRNPESQTYRDALARERSAMLGGGGAVGIGP